MKYRSKEFATCNENGDRQVTLWLDRTLLERLLNKPGKKFTLVQEHPGTVWFHKGSGKRADVALEYACCEVVEWARQIKG